MAVTINIPSQVKTYANLAAFPASGSLKTIYIAEDTNKTYRWTGSVYVEISASAAMTWGQIGGTLSNQTDLQNALDAKVPTTRTLTINGTTQDLSADRTFTISTGITIGTTAIASGVVGRILFEGTGNVVQESGNLFWDNTNGRLGIGTSSPTERLEVTGNVRVNGTQSIFANGSYGLSIIRIGNAGIAQQTYNTTGVTYYGSDSSTGGFLFTSGLPFASFFGSGGNTATQFGTNSAIRMTIFGGGNVAIGTTTDAGFRLDVNGTARVSGNFGVTTGSTISLNGVAGGNGLISGGNSFFQLTGRGVAFLTAFNGGGGDSTAGVQIGFSLPYNGTPPNLASAILEVTSTTKGFLPPRMTTTQKNAIATPATGLQVYDTTLNRPCFYDGTTWITL